MSDTDANKAPETGDSKPLENNANPPAPAQGNATGDSGAEEIRKQLEKERMEKNMLRNKLDEAQKKEQEEAAKKLEEKEEFRTLYEQEKARAEALAKEKEEQAQKEATFSKENEVLNNFSEEVKAFATDAGITLTSTDPEEVTKFQERVSKISERISPSQSPSNPNTVPSKPDLQSNLTNWVESRRGADTDRAWDDLVKSHPAFKDFVK